MVALPRLVANEFVLASVLIPLACSELNAEFTDSIFCSDASMFKGAFCTAPVSQSVCEVLWKATKSEGAYTRLLLPVEVELKKRQSFEERPAAEEAEPDSTVPPRPLAYRFDFVEIFAGSSKITKAMNGLVNLPASRSKL